MARGLAVPCRYSAGVTVPGVAVVVGVTIAGANGGLLGLYDEPIQQSTSS